MFFRNMKKKLRNSKNRFLWCHSFGTLWWWITRSITSCPTWVLEQETSDIINIEHPVSTSSEKLTVQDEHLPSSRHTFLSLSWSRFYAAKHPIIVRQVWIIIIIKVLSYKALSGPQALSKRFTDIYYYPGHRIQAYPHTLYAYSPLTGEHSARCHFLQAHACSSNHINFHILPGTHYNTWVESGKCRSMSYQRTLVLRWDLNHGACDPQSGEISTRPRHLSQ